MRTLNPTAIKIADLAEHYIQTRGFNGFSFRDIQNELGIKTASIHYHFKTKQDLANTVLERYLHRYQAQLTKIYQQHEQAKSMLSAFADEFMQTHQSNKLCLCGMFASDLYSLSKDVVMPLNRFVDINHAWLVSVLKHGITSGEFQQDINPERFAKVYFSSLEGSLLMAQFRTSNDIKEVTNSLIASITETAPSQN
ncbi:TetR/AcrR family transcriptional regulator [Vibrio caribbeanicus]|uniref:Transcriptional regulator n=1 Tax=Vibrio caribbeanicus ATCC BAA-2122 TaxID=796620 RepID=E3BPH8_9VIBR|nr:TetR/AcrR family transcriptional regulator [Vibrio caribbeanicus]EFP95067.1 transcriptional regulator [Vibrio caribbeanicus ATCC BAA-2122]